MKKYKKQTNKNILILGYGKTGKSIATFLKNKKFNIYFWDDNKEILNKINSRFLKYTKQNLSLFHSIFVSPGISKNHKIIKEAIKNKIKISSDIELFLAELENKNNNPLLAITGTNGKSTIASMISKALNIKPLANYGNAVLENIPKINNKYSVRAIFFSIRLFRFYKTKSINY